MASSARYEDEVATIPDEDPEAPMLERTTFEVCSRGRIYLHERHVAALDATYGVDLELAVALRCEGPLLADGARTWHTVAFHTHLREDAHFVVPAEVRNELDIETGDTVQVAARRSQRTPPPE